ncbi:hypothetical protein QR680_004090 [Steinernema hermaphroditum]|uniref:Uncharacterized protein n=1 Tax=Steinernema hermaphroditum TaxID=289476 RepID=A0AA39HPU8_9BILA|nr:hypothetical protein QR680_004090 [Steinernema hermaphroditum]
MCKSPMDCFPDTKCCCGCAHVKTGSLIFSSVNCFWSTVGFIGIIILGILGKTSGSVFNTQFIWNLVSSVISGLSIYGTVKEKKMLILPYIVQKWIELATWILSFMLFFLYLLIPSLRGEVATGQDDHEKRFYIYSVVVLPVATALTIWILITVHNFYNFLKLEERRPLYEEV